MKIASNAGDGWTGGTIKRRGPIYTLISSGGDPSASLMEMQITAAAYMNLTTTLLKQKL